MCLMFLAGLEIDPREMRRAGRVATLAGVSGVIVPLVLGGLIALAVRLSRTGRDLCRRHPDGDERQHQRADVAGAGQAAQPRRAGAAGRGRD